MKRLFALLLLLCLLLAACGAPDAPTAAETAAPPALAGVWVNAGQYTEGRDFVETLTLRADGTASVHLDYQGRPYADLDGTWTADGERLFVDFSDPETRDRRYSYRLTESSLTLIGTEKVVEYIRK